MFQLKKININKNEIENIGYMFRENCFDILEKIFKQKNAQNIDEIKGYSIKYGNIVDIDLVVSNPNASSTDFIVGTMTNNSARQYSFLCVSLNDKPYLPIGQAFIRKSDGKLIIPQGISALDGTKNARIIGSYISLS